MILIAKTSEIAVDSAIADSVVCCVVSVQRHLCSKLHVFRPLAKGKCAVSRLSVIA